VSVAAPRRQGQVDTLDAQAMIRRVPVFIDKIIKGAKPGEIPVEQPTQFELAVNEKTAKAIGLAIPQTILVRADTVVR
jgi:putative tryptophan/tyrosine transport system substrate-binding protein